MDPPPLTDSPGPERLVGLVAADLIGQLRGKMLPLSELSKRLETGVGWTPVNVAIDPFGVIPVDNPFGSRGDVTMRPVPDSEIRVTGLGRPDLHYFMGDLHDQTGARWAACPRGALVTALEALREATGLELRASFEQEFMLVGAPLAGSSYSFERVRTAEPFPSRLVAALSEAGCEPETVQSEYGPDQFEVACRPAAALRAADRALAVREIVREVARTCGWRATFAPLLAPDGVGNGVHVHLSLWSGDSPVTYDPAGVHGLSPTAASFVAGMLAHVAAVCALTAPSPVSYARLQPGRWSAGRAACATGDREALLRIPEIDLAGDGSHDGFNVEFRGVDGTATPHLALAGLVGAGLSGITERLALTDQPDGAVAVSQAGDVLSPGLPTSLGDALDAFESDDAIAGWFSSLLRTAFLTLKRHELHAYATVDLADVCTRYADAY